MLKGERVVLGQVYFVHEWCESDMTKGGYTDYLFVPEQRGRNKDEFIGFKLGEGRGGTSRVRRHQLNAFDGSNQTHANLLWTAVSIMHQALVNIGREEHKQKRQEWLAKQSERAGAK